MEGQQVLEGFDSLWFFATVFSNRAPPLAVVEIVNFTLNDAVEAPGEEIATPIFENRENESSIEDGGGLVSEMKTEVEISPVGKRRKNRGRRSMDLRDAVKEICECWLFEEGIGNGNYYQRRKEKEKKKKKMPRFADSMAMKEHIKSWAYAVACTVR